MSMAKEVVWALASYNSALRTRTEATRLWWRRITPPSETLISKELKPQETGTGLLIRFGEVATTSGSTISFAGSSNSRTSPFEGDCGGASPSPAAKRFAVNPPLAGCGSANLKLEIENQKLTCTCTSFWILVLA